MAGAKRSGGTIAAINGVPPSGAPATSTGVSWSRRMLVLDGYQAIMGCMDGYQAQDSKTFDIIIYQIHLAGSMESQISDWTGLCQKLDPLTIKAPAGFTDQCLETKMLKW